ncbi:E3 ubiquitin-protein ligase Fancl [Aphomia sociella]
MEEIRYITTYGDTPLYFGKTLRDLKCFIQDNNLRMHQLFFRYDGPKKLSITLTSTPYSKIQEQEYSCIDDILETYKNHLNSLNEYFIELEQIDRVCTVMEPANPTFKDDYRRIFLDNKTWLHIEVTPEGLAHNVHLLGKSEYWHEKLQNGLLVWNHDKSIVENIVAVFDICDFSAPPLQPMSVSNDSIEEAAVCNICLCTELADNSGVPLPLCQNKLCGVYFHRNCLFQWLKACSGGRNPSFGVVSGSCPSCFKPISCNEKE